MLMMSSSGTNSDHHKNMTMPCPQIKQEDKFFSRLLSKESSMANPSSRRLYYAGRAGSVPFLWESHPGTPKMAAFRDDHHDHHQLYSDDHGDHRVVPPPPPPLTPPPSYYFNNTVEKLNRDRDNCKRSRSSHLLSSIFPKKFNVINYGLKFKPGQLLAISRSKSSESSSMLGHHSFGSSTTTFRASTGWFSSSSSSFDSRGEDEDEVGDGSPNSTLCFSCYRRQSN